MVWVSGVGAQFAQIELTTSLPVQCAVGTLLHAPFNLHANGVVDPTNFSFFLAHTATSQFWFRF